MQHLQSAEGYKSERKEQETLPLLALLRRVMREEYWAPVRSHDYAWTVDIC